MQRLTNPVNEVPQPVSAKSSAVDPISGMPPPSDPNDPPRPPAREENPRGGEDLRVLAESPPRGSFFAVSEETRRADPSEAPRTLPFLGLPAEIRPAEARTAAIPPSSPPFPESGEARGPETTCRCARGAAPSSDLARSAAHMEPRAAASSKTTVAVENRAALEAVEELLNSLPSARLHRMH